MKASSDDTAHAGQGADAEKAKDLVPEGKEPDYEPAPYEEENKSAFRIGQGKPE